MLTSHLEERERRIVSVTVDGLKAYHRANRVTKDLLRERETEPEGGTTESR